MSEEGRQPESGQAEPGRPEAGQPASRFAFTAPEVQPHIEFKKVRHASGGGRGPHRIRLRLRLRWGRRQLIAALTVLAVLLAGTAWVGVRGFLAVRHLQQAASLFTQLQQQIRVGDTGQTRDTLAALQRETAAARSATSDIGWSLGTKIPFVGDDLAAVRTVAVALDDLTRRSFPTLVDLAAQLGGGVLTPKDGRIDLSGLRGAAPRISDAYAVVSLARTSIGRIDLSGLQPRLRDAVVRLDEGLYRAQGLISTAYRAALLLPPMLGFDGPRTYLVMFQNPAEVRATGGMPGAYLVVSADRGKLTHVDLGMAASAIRSFPEPVLPLTEEQQALYTQRLGVFPADVNLTPDFPTAARLYREMYRLRSGRTVDGVLAVDPVALSYVLRATGPVRVPGGDALTAANAVRLLLKDVYAKTATTTEQDAYYAQAALATFQELTHLRANPRTLVAELARSAGERRLLAWSADPDEQAALAGTVLGGQLPADDGGTPTVGVFLNDGTGAKLSYYLTHQASLTVGDCDEGGGRELKLRLTLGSTAPSSGLPAYVLGLALAGRPYAVRTNVLVFSPTGGSVASASSDGAEVPMQTGTQGNRAVGVFTVDLAPGATRTFEATVLTGDSPETAGAITPELRTTPMVRPWRVDISPGPVCSN